MLPMPAIRHHRRGPGTSEPGRSAASSSAITTMIGPSTKRPCEFTHATWTKGRMATRAGWRSHRVNTARKIERYRSDNVSGRTYMRPPRTRSAGSHATSITQSGQSRRRAVTRISTATQVTAHLARLSATTPPRSNSRLTPTWKIQCRSIQGRRRVRT